MITEHQKGIFRKVGIWALVALIGVMLILIGIVAWQNHKLEKAQQELVEKHKLEKENEKDELRDKIILLQQYQKHQDEIIRNEREENEILKTEYLQLLKSKQRKNDQIDKMDSPALLDELRSIRSENHIL